MDKPALDNLREKLRFRRKNLKLSLRAIGEQTGVSYSSLSRFLGGDKIDAELALRLGVWLGMTGDEVFGRAVTKAGAEDTLDAMRKLILNDESIEENRRDDLWRWFEQTYGTFAKTGN